MTGLLLRRSGVADEPRRGDDGETAIPLRLYRLTNPFRRPSRNGDRFTGRNRRFLFVEFFVRDAGLFGGPVLVFAVLRVVAGFP